MHNLSYEFGDFFVPFGSNGLAWRVWTLENVYGVDQETLRVTGGNGRLILDGDGFFAAGGQLRREGRFHAEVWRERDEIRITAAATHPEKIKCIGILIKGLPEISAVLEYPWTATQPEEVTREMPVEFPHGVTMRYPVSNLAPYPIFLWRDRTGTLFHALNMDEQVRQKRFAVYWNKQREQIVELIAVQAATRFNHEFEMPEWRMGRGKTPSEVYAPRIALMVNKWGLKKWQERADVPGWMRDISLVVTMHAEHWTGYMFNTFARMLEHLEWIARHIEGRRVLVYIPGWDGRYYFSYPCYQVSARLGGEAAFKDLVEGAHALGMRVVPMLGLNGINLKWANELGLDDALARTAHGWADIVNFVDWDADRSGEEQVHWANPGNPNFQDHLVARASELVERFRVDGIFFDILNWYANDPRWDYFEGVRALCLRLKEKFPKLLLFGEGWYDALLPLVPLYHSQVFPAEIEAFTRFARSAYHLSMPAPGAGSTGVHEGGFVEYVPQKFSPILIPTLPIVDDTLPQHEAEVLQVLEVAKEYARIMLRARE